MFAAIASLTLVGCGGGDGGGGTNSGATGGSYTGTAPTLNLSQGLINYISSTSNGSGVVRGTYAIGQNKGDITGNATINVSYAYPTSVALKDISNPYWYTINYTNLHKTSIFIQADYMIDGQRQNDQSIQSIYTTNAGRTPLAQIDEKDIEQSIVTAANPLPTSATRGTGGVWYNATIYSRLGYTCGTENASYSVDAESASSLIVKLTYAKNTQNRTLGECETASTTASHFYRQTATSFNLLYIETTRSTPDGSTATRITFAQ